MEQSFWLNGRPYSIVDLGELFLRPPSTVVFMMYDQILQAMEQRGFGIPIEDDISWRFRKSIPKILFYSRFMCIKDERYGLVFNYDETRKTYHPPIYDLGMYTKSYHLNSLWLVRC